MARRSWERDRQTDRQTDREREREKWIGASDEGSTYFCVCGQTILTEQEKAEFKPVSALLKKGEASFHHALCVHGSYGNR